MSRSIRSRPTVPAVSAAPIAPAVLVAVMVLTAGPIPPVSADQGLPVVAPDPARPACGWVAPVEVDVVDPFRAPGHPYGPGNRGIEYGTVGGETVLAVAAGRVELAGPVAGRLYLVIGHDDGLRSTYGPLRSVAVVRGQAVEAGAAVAEADAGLHLTARTTDRYLDPGPLLDGRCRRPRLVPTPTRRSVPAPGPLRRPVRRGGGGESPPPSYTRLRTRAPGSSAGVGRFRAVAAGTTSRSVDRQNPRSPGRSGSLAVQTTGGTRRDRSRHHEAAPGGRRPLRPPDPPLEPEDEAVHPR